MIRFTKEVRQVIRVEGWNLLGFMLVYRLITIPIYLKLFDFSAKFTLHMAGYSFLTTENIGLYLRKPWTILCILGLLAVGMLFLMVEIGGLISAFQAAAYYRRLGVAAMFENGVKKTVDEILKKNWRLFFLALIQYFLCNLLFIYRLLDRIRPVNFLMEEFFSRPSGYLTAGIIIVGSCLILLPGIFTFHGCTIEQKNFRDSYLRSRVMLRGRWRQTFLPLIGYSVAVLCVFLISYLAFIFVLSVLAVNFSDTALPRAMLLTARDRVELVVLFLSGMMVAVVYFAAVTVEYYHYRNRLEKKDRWDFAYPAEHFLERKKVIAAVLAVALFSLFLSYDAFRNGMGVAEEVLVEIPVTAHRGSSREAPENTMAAIEKAVDDMAEFAEIDIQMTADGKIVLSHDKTLKRTTGVNRKIQSMSYEEVERLDVGSWFSSEFKGEKIPSLEEIMEYAKGRIKLNIEVKDEGSKSLLPEAAAAMIEEFDMADQCVVTSVRMDYLRRIKEKWPEIITGYIVSAAYGDYYSDDAIDFISIRSSLVDKRLMNRIHEKGKAVHVWTVNTKGEMERMKFLQADNIITDKPTLAKSVIYGDMGAKTVMECMKLMLR